MDGFDVILTSCVFISCIKSCCSISKTCRLYFKAAGFPFLILKSKALVPICLLDDAGLYKAFVWAHWGQTFSKTLALMSGILGLTPAKISYIYKSLVKF